MTVKDIIVFACEFVGEKEIVEKFKAQISDETVTFTDVEQNKIDSMLRCFNFVNQEIASDYLPFLHTEKIDVDNSILNFSELEKNIINVYEIKGSFRLKFRVYPNYIQIFGKAKEITYSYLPEDLTLTDEVTFFCGLSARIYAYGMASEFLLIDGLSEDAQIWEERYKESLFVLSRKRSEARLPERRWL